ncbi:MAG: cysteine desulfurase NifS [Candidatus Avilachnospira sp.]|jgi:cysteine desulfurase
MFVYADNAATTSVSEGAVKAMTRGLKEVYGNPSSLHAKGREAEAVLKAARAEVAALINAEPSEIYFTSGGSESDNWAIKGAAKLGAAKGKRHLITTRFEHHAVLHTMRALEKEGFEVTYLDVHENGIVKPEEVEAAIREDTALVTIMFANNEIGSIQPIREIGKICREKGVLFHTDAVQATGHLSIDVKADNIDMMSASGHKFHGPKGVGFLYVKRGIRLPNLIEGGAQESSRRAGTENLPGILGMAEALKEAVEGMEEHSKKVTAMRDKLIAAIEKIPKVRLNGDREKRLPGNVNFCFDGIEGESLLLSLDLEGICASSGSACTSGSLEPSHVLLAIGVPKEVAHGSLRLSLDYVNSEEEVDYIIEKLPPIVERLRDMSPVWEEIIKEESRLSA